MNQNAEVFAALLAPLNALAGIRWWHIALTLAAVLTVLGLALYGALALIGVA